MKKRILIAPLNWGLGHATRCIPIINALLKYDFEPVIASDGIALNFLKKEFPNLEFHVLPSYNITYPKKGSLKWHFIKKAPKLYRTIKKEAKTIDEIIIKRQIEGIISDNRFGAYSNKIPSVYITHQLNVLSGNTTWLTSKIHRKIVNKFDECWIPDTNDSKLSGILSDIAKVKTKTKHIGSLSRLNHKKCEPKYDLLVILSGPEPQRTFLEESLYKQLKKFKGKTVLIRGIIEDTPHETIKENLIIYNYRTSNEIEKLVCESSLILARSGYSTIMDMAKLIKKAYFIPTPGQFEQEYLAKHLNNLRIAPFCFQEDFTIEKLDEINNFKGFSGTLDDVISKELFSLFEGK